MRNGFGFKDLVMLALLLAVAVSVWLSMVQRDRQWELLQRVDALLPCIRRTKSTAGNRNHCVTTMLHSPSQHPEVLEALDLASGASEAKYRIIFMR